MLENNNILRLFTRTTNWKTPNRVPSIVYRLSSLIKVGFIVLYCFCVNAQTAPIARISFNEGTGNELSEEISGTAFTIKNQFPKPAAEWITGVEGTALRLNGYATNVEGAFPALPSSQITLSLWFALETFPTGEGALFSIFEGTKGIKTTVSKFGNLAFFLNTGGVFTDFLVSEKLEKFKWNHLVWVINTDEKQTKIYLNGEMIFEKTIPAGSLTFPSNRNLLIGKNTTNDFHDIFNKNLLNGLIDEIKLYDTELPSEDIATLYNSELPTKVPDLSIPSTRFETDIHRPQYHAIPAAGWMNEPHGMIYDNGEYHIFYQKNGNGPYWSQQNWGYLSSPDLIHWEEQPAVLSPEPGDDNFGCWSGTILKDDNGTPTIMYTGVDGGTAQMMLAYGSEDWSTFEKFDGNPVVKDPPALYRSPDFRDPFIWKEFGEWQMVIGSGLLGAGNSGGAVLHYTSPDLINWEYKRPFYKGFPSVDNSGEFWEMPVVWKFGDKHILLVNPIPWQGAPAKMLYWTGKFDGNLFLPDSFDPKQFGATRGMLSPSFAYDKDGRTIAMGIIPDGIPSIEQRENGWAHIFSLPRVLDLDENNFLTQRPHPVLEQLRGTHYHFDSVAVAAGESGFLSDIKGRHLEIKAKIDPENAKRMGFLVAQAPDDSERTRVYYDFGFKAARAERGSSSTNPNARQTDMTLFEELPEGEELDLHLFLDGSVLELFVNGRFGFAARIFPENPESTGIDLYVRNGAALFKSVDIWEIKPLEEVTVSTNEASLSKEKSIINKVYPNPFSNQLNVDLALPQNGTLDIALYDLLGKKVHHQSFGKQIQGKQLITINTTNLPPNLYFIKVNLNGVLVGSERIINIKN